MLPFELRASEAADEPTQGQREPAEDAKELERATGMEGAESGPELETESFLAGQRSKEKAPRM